MAQRINVQYVQFYTGGSAAKRVAPAISVHTGALPMPKKRKVHRIYVDPVATLGILVAVSMLIMMAVGVSQLRAEQTETAAMVEYVEQLQGENVALQAQYDEECDLEMVEKTALALGMIPRQDAPHVSIEIPMPQQQETVSLWQRIGTFLTGLFA